MDLRVPPSSKPFADTLPPQPGRRRSTTSALKESYAWWFREYLEGLKGEIEIPADWKSVRTILIFTAMPKERRPRVGDQLYFEIPVGIEQIDSLWNGNSSIRL